MIIKIIFATILTGIFSGILITIYELLIIFVKTSLFMGDPKETISKLPVWYIYLIPTVAIFIVNILVSRDPNIKEYTINEIADSIVKNRMTLRLKTLFFKIISSTLSLASGFMVGTEGPSAGIGAMIAYNIHKLFKLPKMLVKMMISVGASSAIAAIFVSPLTGIAFAVEYIAYQFLKKHIAYLIVGSIIAFAISINFLEPINFYYSVGRNFDLKFFIASLVFIPYITVFVYFYLFLKKKVLRFIDLEIFKNASKYRNYIFSIIGGGVVGTILLIEPHAAFSGKEMVNYLINKQSGLGLEFVFTILILRIIGTTVSIYANSVGGMFLPLMTIGALAGYSFGIILADFNIIKEPFYFASVGAAVFMGVLMKLPLTSLVLSLETTFDYNIVIATGIVVVAVEYISSLYFHISRKYIGRADKIWLRFKNKKD